MRKIEQRMVGAVRIRHNYKTGNTEVAHNPLTDITHVYLHGNLIAMFHGDEFKFTLAGWPTPTMRSRVNALLREFGTGRAYVCQSGGTQYYRWADELREIGPSEWVTVQQ